MVMKMEKLGVWFGYQELLEGKIVVKSSSSISHYGIRLTVNGSVNLQVCLFPANINGEKKN